MILLFLARIAGWEEDMRDNPLGCLLTFLLILIIILVLIYGG